MTIPERQPKEGQPRNDSMGESQPIEIPTITGSPWRNRREFGTQLEAATLESLRANEQGELFRWDWVNIFGDKISITLENLPNDELIGAHTVIHMTQGEDTLGMEINTVGVRIYRDLKPLGDNIILDVGEDDQITTFIEICARALEVGIPPDGIIEAAASSKTRRGDRVGSRRQLFDQKLKGFSRELSERQFL